MRDKNSPTYTPKRRSFVNMANGCKEKLSLHRLWPKHKSAMGSEHNFKNWTRSDLSSVIRLAGFQMGALGNPANPVKLDADAVEKPLSEESVSEKPVFSQKPASSEKTVSSEKPLSSEEPLSKVNSSNLTPREESYMALHGISGQAPRVTPSSPTIPGPEYSSQGGERNRVSPPKYEAYTGPRRRASTGPSSSPRRDPVSTTSRGPGYAIRENHPCHWDLGNLPYHDANRQSHRNPNYLPYRHPTHRHPSSAQCWTPERANSAHRRGYHHHRQSAPTSVSQRAPYAHGHQTHPSVPMPNRAPPPIPRTLRVANGYGPSAQQINFIRRAKTPVTRIGQLEMAATLRTVADCDRTSSLSSVARQYRELIDDSEVSSIYSHDSQHQQGQTPVQPRRLSQPQEPARPTGSLEHQPLAESILKSLRLDEREQFHVPSHAAPSPPASDDGKPVTRIRHAAPPVAPCDPSLSPPATPLVDSSKAHVEDDKESSSSTEPATPGAKRLQIGVELLTRELSSSLADRDTAGLRVWVLIEAYEQLKAQLATKCPGSEEIMAIDSWLEALHALHTDLASEAAMSESEYGE